MKRGHMLTQTTAKPDSAQATPQLAGEHAGADEQAQTQLDRTFRIKSGRMLELQLETGGVVEIVGWQENTVALGLHVGGRDWRDCKYEANESPSGILIVSRYAGDRHSHSTSLRFRIKVPRRFNVKINSSGGEIKVSGVNGHIVGRTLGGDLKLTRLQGEVYLATMRGNVILCDSEVDGELITMSGQVLLHGVKGSVEASSKSGQVFYKNVSNHPDSVGRV